MTLKETLTKLKALGAEKMPEHNFKHGAGKNKYHVKRGDKLWHTENIYAVYWLP